MRSSSPGLLARTRRPENRTGLLLIGVGFAWFLNGLSFANNSYVWTVGFAVGAVWAAVFVHTLLAYPSGRLEERWQRSVVIFGYCLAGLANLAIAFFDSDPASCKDCPANRFLVSDNDTVATVVTNVVQVLAAVFLVSVAVALWLRWRGSTSAARRLLGPVLIAGGISVALLGISLFVQTFSQGLSNLFGGLAAISFVAVPFLLLWGILRARLARADLGRLLVETAEHASPGETQANLRRALHDPTLDLVFWLVARETYVGIDGQPYQLPERDPARAVTPIADADRPVGALVHDPSLLDEPELVESFVAAARLAIERDRLQAELLARVDELQHERDFVRDVVNAAPSYFVVVDENGLLVRFNDTLRGAAGIPDDDSTRGRPWWGLFAVADDAAGLRDWFFTEARRESELTAHEARMEGRAGELVTSWSLVRLSDESNRSLFRSDEEYEQRWLLTGIDLTERVRQQRALETSERRSRALLEGVPDNIYRVARDGHRFLDIRWADPTRLPVPQERFIGGTVRDLGLPGDLADRFIELAETAFATGRVQSLEYEVRPGGEPLYLEARIVPSGDDEYFVTVRDVTDRLRAQHALETSERRSRALLAGVPDNIFRIAHAGHNIVDVRWARPSRLPVAADEVVGSTVHEIGLPAAVADRVVAAAERAAATGEVQVLEYELPDPAGSQYLESSVVSSGDEYYVVVRDVTDRKQAELALQLQRDLLSEIGDATPAFLAVVGPDGTMSQHPINHALRELTGLSTEDAGQKNSSPSSRQPRTPRRPSGWCGSSPTPATRSPPRPAGAAATARGSSPGPARASPRSNVVGATYSSAASTSPSAPARRRSCAALARGSSRPATPNAGASNAISTTALSSGWFRSRFRCGSLRRG